MPQLDLAIYSLHIICFFIFYVFLYVYLRGGLLLNISSLFKYRSKLLNYFYSKKDLFLNKYVIFNIFLDMKIRKIVNSYLNFTINFFTRINLLFFFWFIFFINAFNLKKNSLL